MPQIARLTLFQVSDPAVLEEAVQKYSTLKEDAVQDGKPYIQMASASIAHEDPRSLGYRLVARTVFNSKEDMDYYDNECAAHAAIKTLIKPKIASRPLVVYMDA